MDRCEIVHDNFLRRVAAGDLPAGNPPSGPLTGPQAVAVFRAGASESHAPRSELLELTY